MVHKFRLEHGRNVVPMQRGAQVLCAGVDGKQFTCIWVHVPETDAPEVSRIFFVFATGEAMPMNDLRYVGTAFSAGHVYVWHVYELLA
jgi:hypothetical protein